MSIVNHLPAKTATNVSPFTVLQFATEAKRLFYSGDLSSIASNNWIINMPACTTAENMFYWCVFPADTKITLTGNALTSMKGLFYYAGGYTTVPELKEVVLNSTASVTTMDNLFFRSAAHGVPKLEKVTLGFSTAACTNWSNAFRCYNGSVKGDGLKTIAGTLDFSALTTEANASMTFGECVALETMTWAPSSLSVSLSLAHSDKLTDATLISIANGLNALATGKTLTLHATAAAKLPAIRGTVTGGVFAANAQGSTTLSDFITTVKGWTVA